LLYRWEEPGLTEEQEMETMPVCGAGETEGVNGCAVQLQWDEELVEGREVGGRVIDSCSQKGG